MAKAPRLLGKPATIPASPREAVLDRVPNPHPDASYVARFTAPEFTVLCPITGQPDFAHLVIDYVPRRWLVESKSLKLYLQSFRNAGTFHEHVVNVILDDVVSALAPRWCKITADFAVRGGIAISVDAEFKR